MTTKNPWDLNAALNFTKQVSNAKMFGGGDTSGMWGSSGAGTSQMGSYAPGQSQFQTAADVSLPSWLQTNPNKQLGELMSAYGQIPAAYDTSGQVGALNDAMAYQTAGRRQTASNVASEYANRAMQSGGSTLGAGAVKAQAMLPVYAANAQMKMQGEDIQAKARQEAVSKASEIGSALGSLRNSYLGSLSQFVQGQQNMNLQNQQFNVGTGLEAFRANSQNFNDAQQRKLQSRQIAMSGRSSGSTQGQPPPFMGSQTYIPNAGGLQTNPAYTQYLQKYGLG